MQRKYEDELIYEYFLKCVFSFANNETVIGSDTHALDFISKPNRVERSCLAPTMCDLNSGPVFMVLMAEPYGIKTERKSSQFTCSFFFKYLRNKY